MAAAERSRNSSQHRRPSRKQKTSGKEDGLPRGVSDRLILSQADQVLPGTALLVLVAGSAVARHLINARPDVTWKVFTCEHFYLAAVLNALSENDSPSAAADVELFCTPDLPTGELDTVILPLDSRGSSEFTHDLLQSIAGRLKPSGRLILSTNNAKDHRLHEHLKATFGRITVVKDAQGVCFIARSSGKPNKQKDYCSEFAFRDGERLIRCASRPGVFGHRRVEAGARALIRSLDLLTADPWSSGKPPRRIVEMGCGGGAVAVAAALRYPPAKVLAVDSHARAVQSTEQTAELNAARNVSILLTSDGRVPNAGQHDLFLCNPPYYSDFRISELFLQSAVVALRRGGRIHLVTKHADWHENRMIEIFANATVHQFGACSVIVSRR